MNWKPDGTATGNLGDYRVVPHNPDGGPGYDCELRQPGFVVWQLILTDPSRINAQLRADDYDLMSTPPPTPVPSDAPPPDPAPG